MVDIQLLEERMKIYAEKIEKLNRCVFGKNGDPGLKGEHEVMKNNLIWIKWLLGLILTIQLPMAITYLARLL